MLVIQAVNATPQFINVPITLLVGDTSQMKIGGVSNAASFKPAFAPGMEMSVYGVQLAPAGTAQSAGSLPLPLNLAGVSATVNGLTAPLYYLSPGQLNVQVPYETSAGTAILGVNNNGQVASFPFQVAAAAPGIFTDANGALVPYGSGSAGAVLLIYITGAGDLTPSIPTGYTPASQTPLADLPQTLLPVVVTVGGVRGHGELCGCHLRAGGRGADQLRCSGWPACRTAKRGGNRRGSRGAACHCYSHQVALATETHHHR